MNTIVDLSNYRAEDAGTYTCQAANEAGLAVYDMSVAIQGK